MQIACSLGGSDSLAQPDGLQGQSVDSMGDDQLIAPAPAEVLSCDLKHEKNSRE